MLGTPQEAPGLGWRVLQLAQALLDLALDERLHASFDRGFSKFGLLLLENLDAVEANSGGVSLLLRVADAGLLFLVELGSELSLRILDLLLIA